MRKTKKAGLGVVVVLLAGGGVIYVRNRPTPAPVCYPDLGPAVTLPSVPDEPLEPTKPPVVPVAAPLEWLCENPGTLSSRQRSEDAWLREILASPLDWPPWGVPEWAAQAAECAARRERCRWMECN